MTRDLIGEGDLLMMRVRGDSMIEADLREGDQVVIRRQDTAEEGEMVAALLLAKPEPEITLKFLSRRNGRILFLPANPGHEPVDAEQAAAKIIGKAIGLLRRL